MRGFDSDSVFRDRGDAGRQLATAAAHLAGERVVVLGLPRGGVPVALEVALALGAPLDVMMVRKLGVPQQPELAMGAIAEDGVQVLNPDVIRLAGVTAAQIEAVAARERVELERRAAAFRGTRERPALISCTAVVVDDGIATGATARAACAVLRHQHVVRLVLAVPVAPLGWEADLGDSADEYIAVFTPADFGAVGRFYADFAATTDDEVVSCLRRADARPRASGGSR
jgi:putative phosphoribosyl transferase